MTPQDTKETCPHCNGKGYNTQLYGEHYSADFVGDKSYDKAPTIHKNPCKTCKGSGFIEKKTQVVDTKEDWKAQIRKVKLPNEHDLMLYGYEKMIEEIEDIVSATILSAQESERQKIVQLLTHCMKSGFSPETTLDLVESNTHNDELLAEDYGVTSSSEEESK